MTRTTRILLIEDNPGHDSVVRKLFQDADGDFAVQSAGSLEKGLRLLKTDRFDAVVLDLRLPDSIGLETLDIIQTVAPSLPIIVKASPDDEQMAIAAIRHGAQDYLINGSADHELLSRTIRSAIVRTRAEVDLKAEIFQRKQAEMKLLNSHSDLDLLSDTASELLRESDPHKAVKRLCNKVMEHLDCQMFFNYLVDEAAGKLRLNAYAGISEKEAQKIEWLDFGAAVSGCVARDGKRVVVESARTRPNELTRLKSYGARAYACHPLLSHENKVIGTLSFGAANRDAFNEEDISLMKIVANQVAIAIMRFKYEQSLREAIRENTKFYRQEREMRTRLQRYTLQLSRLHNTSLSLNRETDKRKLMGSVLQGVSELVNAEFGAIFVTNQGRTRLVAQYNISEKNFRISEEIIEGLNHRVEALINNSTRDVIRINNANDLKMIFPNGHHKVEPPELLVSGLRGRGGAIRGFFILGLKSGGRKFSKPDEEMAWLLASQASVALVSLENFEQEHMVAAALQDAMLPIIPARSDVTLGLFYKSASEVSRLGGDFYDVFDLDGGKIAIMVGDVCGKGLQAATSTAMIKYTTRAYLQTDPDPGRCLTLTNQAVMNQLSMDRFVTLSLAVFDPGNLSLYYASAGHPPPVIVRGTQAELLKANVSVPLGVVNSYSYHKVKVNLGQSCAFLMYTDGLIEARPEAGEPFGTDRLLTAAASRRCLPAQQLADALSQRVNDYTGAGNGIKDDICLLVMELGRADASLA